MLGFSRADLQAQGWLFEDLPHSDFTEIWVAGYNYAGVDWSVVFHTVIDFIPLVPILLFSFFVSFGACRKAGGFDNDADKDALFTGVAFLVESLLCGPMVAIASAKVVLPNISISGGQSRLPTAIIAVTSLAFFLGPPLLPPYIPKFYLGFICLYISLGFLLKYFLESYQIMSRMEYAVVWVMMVVEPVRGMEGSVLIGLLVATCVFALKYSQRGIIRGLRSGADARRLAPGPLRTPREEAVLRHRASELLVVQLHNYLFFGGVLQVEQVCKEIVLLRENQRTSSRARYVVIDWKEVPGMDATVPGALENAIRSLRRSGLEVIFTAMQTNLEKTMRKGSGTFSLVSRVLPKLRDGIAHAEEAILARSASIRARWLTVSDGAKAAQAHAKALFCHNVLLYTIGPYCNAALSAACQVTTVEAGTVLATAGEECTAMWIVQRGLLHKLNAGGHWVASLARGSCCNESAEQ
jgi:SulP family sulfate permease